GADLTGESDSTAAIQAAIDAAEAAGGGVVYLPEGFYQLSVAPEATTALTIGVSNVILRGAGSDRTFLFNTSYRMRGKSVIQVGDFSVNWGDAVSDKSLLQKDYPGPALELALDSITAFKVGDWVAVHSPATD